jgi:AcrR family transcriptional regulator
MVDRLRAGVERLLAEGTTYAEIPIDAVVREGGTAKSTFYAYFADKDALLRRLAAQTMSELVSRKDAWWALPGGATREQTQAALSTMYDAYRVHGPLMRAITEARIYDAKMKAEFDRLTTGVIAATADHLRAGQAAGTVGPGVDVDRVALWLTWTLERAFQVVLPTADGEVLERRLRALNDLIWAAYTAEAVPA